MAKRDARLFERPAMRATEPKHPVLKAAGELSPEARLRSTRGGQGDDTRWLPAAAAEALQSAGTDRVARGLMLAAPAVLGRVAPVFRSAAGRTGGVHVPRAAAGAADRDALATYDRLLGGRRFADLARAEQLDIVRKTGWQGLPTGETVKQLPGFKFGPGWKRYEPFATETRAVLSGLGERSAADVPAMSMSEAFAGEGAEEFFRYMPDARRWVVRADVAPAPRVMGYSEPGSTAVTVTDEALARGAEPVLGTVHHETQHVIQNMSRMSPGSTSADALAELKAGVWNAVLDGRGGDPDVVRAAEALQTAERMGDPAYYAYQHTGGEAAAFAAGNGAVEGPVELISDAMVREGITPKNVYDLRVLRQDAKGGKDRFSMSRNFLATDKVPDTLFGIPVVSRREDYTDADLRFFREHPEAGGYYDLGEETPEDGSAEGAPVQADMPKRGRYPGSLNNPGNVEKRAARRRGEVDSPHERWAKFDTPQNGLTAAADVIRQIAAVKLAEEGKDFTIRNFAEIYAPRKNKKGKPENNTDKYIADISADSGFGADDVLHRWDGRDMARLLKSVVKFESGAPHSAWFTDDEYAAAAELMKEGAFD